jgi:hypothetical protein
MIEMRNQKLKTTQTLCQKTTNRQVRPASNIIFMIKGESLVGRSSALYLSLSWVDSFAVLNPLSS